MVTWLLAFGQQENKIRETGRKPDNVGFGLNIAECKSAEGKSKSDGGGDGLVFVDFGLDGGGCGLNITENKSAGAKSKSDRGGGGLVFAGFGLTRGGGGLTE